MSFARGGGWGGFQGCALPVGRWSHGSHWIVETCPGTQYRTCGARNHLYLNVSKGVGYCFKCELKVFGKEGLYRIWPELEGQAETKPAEFANPISTHLANPQVFGVNAWEVPESRHYLMEKYLTESLCRMLPIYWVPLDSQFAIMADPLSPEYPEAPWCRALSEKAKWRPLTGTQSKAYGWGIRYLPRNIDSVVMCEGIFDILTSGLVGQAVALLGTRAREVWPSWCRSRGVKKVSIWLDADDKGDEALFLRLIPLFKAWNIEVRPLLTKKDPKRYVNQGKAIVRAHDRGETHEWNREHPLAQMWGLG